MRRSLRRGAVVMVALACAAAGCGDDDGGSGGSRTQRTVTIGVLAPLDAGVTQFGRGIRNSVQLAVDQARDANLLPAWRLAVVPVDDSSDPAVGVRNVQQLLDDPTVVGIVGTYNSGVATAVLPRLAAAGIPLLSPGNTDPALTLGPDRDHPKRPYDNYFRLVAHDALQGGVLARAAVGLGFAAAAVVTDAKPVSQGLANDFRAAFIADGGSILSFEVVPDGDTDYTPYARRAAATHPALLFFGGEYDHATLLKQAAVTDGLDAPLMGGDGIQADEYIAATGASTEGDLASSVGAPIARDPGAAAFLAAYDAHGFAEGPSTFGPYAYDAANMLLSAASGALAGHSAVVAAVRSDITARVQAITNGALINPGGAVTGAIGFDVFGDTINPELTIYRVQDARWTALETLPLTR